MTALTALLVTASALAGASFKDSFILGKFYKANTHAHTRRSDGDSRPEEVLAWYKSRGYQFVALTDHNVVTDRRFLIMNDKPGELRIVPGEEVSWMVKAPGARAAVPLHVTSLCALKQVGGREVDIARSSALKKIFNSINEQAGALAVLAHPNFEWALDLADFGPLTEYTLIELFNTNPDAHSEGGTDKQGQYRPSIEALWDKLLTAGRTMYGIATDDMHELSKMKAELGFEPRRGGGAWIEVAAPKFERAEFCAALKAGRFYATTGIELESIAIEDNQMALKIKPLAGVAPNAVRTDFITSGGKVVAQKTGLDIAYRLRGGETRYLRARVTAPGLTNDAPKRVAWIQPVAIADAPARR